jgi:putative transposase
MNSLALRYTMYFNRKYKRVGHLYQGVYKAVLITSEPQFLHLSRYIHQQALASQDQVLRSYSDYSKHQPCSYLEYLNKRKTEWVHPEEVLSYFDKTNPNLSYKAFVKQDEDSEDNQLSQNFILEKD